MNKIITALENKIRQESPYTTKEHESYVSGLADALEIVKEVINNDLVIGETYYVLMPKGESEAEIVPMQLYRINHKKKIAYCFSKNLSNITHCYPSSPDLVLYNQTSIKLRVYRSREEAERNMNILWRLRKR